MLWITLFFIAVDYPLFRIFYERMFPEPGDLAESLHDVLTPSILSLFRGNFRDSLVSKGRLMLFVLLCVSPVVLEDVIVSRLFHL